MPVFGDLHEDARLTNISVMYRNDDFIADLICPIVPVEKESDKYIIFGNERFNTPKTLRAPRTESAGVEWSLSDDTYSCDEHALHALLDEREIANADAQLNIERTTVEFLTDQVLLGREIRVAAAYQATGTFNTVEPSPNWNEASAVPVDDVLAAKERFRIATGIEPNVMVLPKTVLATLKTVDSIIDSVKYSALGKVTIDLLQTLFEIPRILTPGAMYNTAAEGDTEALSSVWTDTVGLYYVPPSPGQRMIATGYTFRARGFKVNTATVPTRHSRWYEPSMVEDIKIVCAGAGELLNNCIA